MNKINKIKYIVLSSVFVVAPVAMAQWDVAGDHADSGLPTGTITDIITSFMNWILVIVGLVGVIGFAVSGILYLISAGDETQISKAKSAMTWSIVGVVVALMGLVIIIAVNSLLGGSDADF